MNEFKHLAIEAVNLYKGDNLYRAEIAFKGQNLDEHYGQSGRTKREILDNYRKHEKLCNETIEWLKGV